MMKLSERSEGNFFMFLKTNEGYLSQIVLKNMQFLVSNKETKTDVDEESLGANF